jgi:predicted amidohydrolase YtcJ
MLWILNSTALEQLDFSTSDDVPEGVERATNGRWTGRFFNLDKWLRQRSAQSWPSLKQLSLELARQGITGVTDAGASNGLAEWRALARAMTNGELLQRVQVMGSEQLSECAPDIHGRLTRGPLKVYLREAALPDYDMLVDRIRTSHANHRPIASHCVTRTELAFLLAALTEAGSIPGDRVEHASITDEHALEVIARLGVTVVTQPHFITERGSQYLTDVATDELPMLYRGAGFLHQGIPLAAGSDAPYGAISPWRSMEAAITRNTACNTTISPRECLQGRQALALFGGTLEQPGATLTSPGVGECADLCLLDRPWVKVERAPGAVGVALTVCNGKITHRESVGSPV